MRLPASLRLKASRDFARVRREGTSFPGRYVVVSVLRDPALTKFQFGLITTRKIGNAVVRNRTRRRLREVIREQQMLIINGCYVVTIARWRAPAATLNELRRDWLGAAKRAGIIKSKSEFPKSEFPKSEFPNSRIPELQPSEICGPVVTASSPSACPSSDLAPVNSDLGNSDLGNSGIRELGNSGFGNSGFRISGILIRLSIRVYQRLLSPVIHFIGGPGSGCRYQPTCSEYFLQAVIQHGSVKGSWLGVKRIARCHPWGGQGFDPVPGCEHLPLPRR